jgi:hypothetical protein
MTKWFALAFIAISAQSWGTGVPCIPLDASKSADYKIGRFYTLHEGSDMLPLAWLQVLPVWDLNGHKTGRNFLDRDNLKRYGLLDYSSPSGAIGLSVSESGMLGVNCAACHVNQMKIGGRTTAILNGAPSLFDVEKFAKEMYYSLLKVCEPADWAKCSDFTKSIVGLTPDQWKTDLAEFRGRLKYVLTLASLGLTAHSYAFGPGRIDDFGGARDVLWGDPSPLTATNKVPLVGPSSILDLWSFQGASWIHWDLNMNSTFDRNLGQAITGGALYGGNHFRTPSVPLTDVTVDACAIAELETIAEQFQAPKWPVELAPIDTKTAEAGKAIFSANCEHCHRPNLSDSVLPFSSVGTDPNRALAYWLPMSDGTDFLQTANTDLPNLKAQIFKILELPPDSVQYVDKLGKNARWRRTNGYVARPLKGIWASPPYLHNGSVLTLMEILDSKSRHYPDTFQLGHQDFDPVKVGYVRKDCIPGDYEHFCFDTRLPGNSNQGHTYGDALTTTERKQVVEYLKTR